MSYVVMKLASGTCVYILGKDSEENGVGNEVLMKN